jgi:tetratricopeptide (TPR) repeat protein
MTAAGNTTPGSRSRLDSWKEIAAFFSRDERTVNRWEKELGLPVHRLPGRAKGPVYAYTDELAAWMASSPENRVSVGVREVPQLAEKAASSAPSQPLGPVLVSPVLVSNVAVHGSANPAPRSRRLSSRWFVGGVLASAGLLGWALLYPSGKPDSRSSNRPGSGSSTTTPRTRSGIVQASTPAHNPEAEQLYLQGRYYWNKRTPADLTKAVDFFTQAIVKDPGYSNAYVGLADCYNLLREYTVMPPSEAYPRALAAAQKAVELDDKSSEAHASLAFASFWGKWDFVTADREFQRAVELDPNNAVAHHWYATHLAMLQRFPESLTEINRAQALNPTSTSILADKGDLLLVAGRTSEALTLLKHLETTEPKFASIPRYLKFVYFAKSDYPDFLAEWRKESTLVQDAPSLALVATAEKGFAAGGKNGMLENVLTLQRQLYTKELQSPYDIARTCSLLGRKPEAFRYLNEAYEKRDPLLIAVKVDTAFEGLRDEAEYRDLLTRMGFPTSR